MSDNQAQTQQQSQVISINVTNSGDPVLEGRILNGAYGVGRQLGALSAVIALLLDEREGAAAPSGTADAIAKFREMRAAIADEKRRRGPSRVVERLQAGDVSDAAESRELCRQVRAWLDEYEAALSDAATAPARALP